MQCTDMKSFDQEYLNSLDVLQLASLIYHEVETMPKEQAIERIGWLLATDRGARN